MFRNQPHISKVATITEAQVRQIAERKMPDLNANDLDAATEREIFPASPRESPRETE